MREVAFRCSCPSRKFPCKHSLGLLLLFASQAGAFRSTDQPEWVSAWLESRSQRAAKQQEKHDIADTPEAIARRQDQQSKRAASREQNVSAGLADLQLWLQDVIRRGLATVAQEPVAFWESMAARMVDTQAPGAARLLREASQLVNVGDHWQDRLLRRLARLHLLVEGYRDLAAQPPEMQAEIRAILGWTQASEELAAHTPQADNWAVMAQTMDVEDRLRVQRTWLWGLHSLRPALRLDFAHGSGPLDVSFCAGTCVAASVVYYDAAWPLRAIVRDQQPARPLAEPVGYESIPAALDAYDQALAASPFIEQFPVPLKSACLLRDGDGWLIRDAGGHVLPAYSSNTWRLLSLGGGRPMGVFGLWDGSRLGLLSGFSQGRYLQLGTTSPL